MSVTGVKAGTGIGVDLIGKAALDRLFRELPRTTARKVLRQALRAGAKIILPAAKAATPVRTGALRAAIKIKAGKKTRSGLSVNVMMGAGFFKGPTFYGSFLELGAPGHMWRGRVIPLAARHFMRDAAERSIPAARRVVLATIASGIEREAKSLGGGAR